MLVWTGRGILAVLVLLASFALLVLLLPVEISEYGIVGSLFVTATFSWFMGRKWNGGHGQVVIDKETGQEISLKANHSIFWINLEYWGIIFGVLGIVLLVQQFI